MSDDFIYVRLGDNPVDIQFKTAKDCGNFFIEKLQQLEAENERLKKENVRLTELVDQHQRYAIRCSENKSELQSLRTQLSKAKAEIETWKDRHAALDRLTMNRIMELYEESEQAKAEGVILRSALKRIEDGEPYPVGIAYTALNLSPLIEKEVRIREAKDKVIEAARNMSGVHDILTFNHFYDLLVEALDQLTHENKP